MLRDLLARADSLLALAAGVADHAGRAADDGDRRVPGQLEAAQQHSGNKMADVQAVGRGIEAGVDRAWLFRQPGRQIRIVGRLMNKVTPAEIVEKRMFEGQSGRGSAEGGMKLYERE